MSEWSEALLNAHSHCFTCHWELGPAAAGRGKAGAAANMCCLALGRHAVAVFCRQHQAGDNYKLFNGAMHRESKENRWE